MCLLKTTDVISTISQQCLVQRAFLCIAFNWSAPSGHHSHNITSSLIPRHKLIAYISVYMSCSTLFYRSTHSPIQQLSHTIQFLLVCLKYYMIRYEIWVTMCIKYNAFNKFTWKTPSPWRKDTTTKIWMNLCLCSKCFTHRFKYIHTPNNHFCCCCCCCCCWCCCCKYIVTINELKATRTSQISQGVLAHLSCLHKWQ